MDTLLNKNSSLRYEQCDKQFTYSHYFIGVILLYK